MSVISHARAMAAVYPAGPELVDRRAQASLLAPFQAPHPVAAVALGGVAGRVDRGDDRHRFVLTVFALGDQHRQAKIRVGLERDRRSVVGRGLSGGSCHLLYLLAPFITPKPDTIKRNLWDQRRKPARPKPGGPEGRRAKLLVDAVGALA